jgi:hypothetical protein
MPACLPSRCYVRAAMARQAAQAHIGGRSIHTHQRAAKAPPFPFFNCILYIQSDCTHMRLASSFPSPDFCDGVLGLGWGNWLLAGRFRSGVSAFTYEASWPLPLYRPLLPRYPLLLSSRSTTRCNGAVHSARLDVLRIFTSFSSYSTS